MREEGGRERLDDDGKESIPVYVCLPIQSHAVFWAKAPAPGKPLPLESASVYVYEGYGKEKT